MKYTSDQPDDASQPHSIESPTPLDEDEAARPGRKIRVIIVDSGRPDEGALLPSLTTLEIVGRAESVVRALAMARRIGVDVRVLDLRMHKGTRAQLISPWMAGVPHLSPQEQRVLELVAQGMTNKEIARALCISAKTVKNYLSNTFQKLQVRGRLQAANVLEQLGRAARRR